VRKINPEGYAAPVAQRLHPTQRAKYIIIDTNICLKKIGKITVLNKCDFWGEKKRRVTLPQ